MVDRPCFWVLDFLTPACLDSTISDRLLIVLLFGLSEFIKHDSDQGSNVSGPLLRKLFVWSQLTGHCVANFRFASEFRVVIIIAVKSCWFLKLRSFANFSTRGNWPVDHFFTPKFLTLWLVYSSRCDWIFAEVECQAFRNMLVSSP